MKRIFAIIFLVQCAALAASPAIAAQPAAEPIVVKSDKKLTVRFKRISLPSLFRFISRETGLSFKLADPALNEMHVTVFGRDIPIESLLEMLVKSKGLEFQRDAAEGVYLVRKAKSRPAFPEPTRKDLESPLMKNVVNQVRVKEVHLAEFLDLVSRQAQVNFVVTDETADIKITAELDHTTVADILQFLRSRGLEYSRITHMNTFVIRLAEDPVGSFAEAEKAFKEKNYERSAAIYKDFAVKNPGSDMADFALLRSAVSYDWLAASNNSPQALKSEEEALLSLIKDYPASQRRGDAYLYLGQIYSGHAGAAIKAIDCKKALAFYKLAMENTYRDWVKAQALVRKGQCHALAGDQAAALAVYREAALKYPDEEIVKSLRPLLDGQRTLLNAGLTLEDGGDYKLAAEVYEAALRKDPSSEAGKEAARRLAFCKGRLH